jgi:hypothetical protein
VGEREYDGEDGGVESPEGGAVRESDSGCILIERMERSVKSLRRKDYE